MKVRPNPIRGEVAASIGSLDLILVADMDGLARLSAATGYPALHELYARLHGTEPSTVMLALEYFITSGSVDGKKLGKAEAFSQARLRLTLDDLLGLQGPLKALLAALMSPTGSSRARTEPAKPESVRDIMRRWLEQATGTLNISAAQFWRMSLAEYVARVEGYKRANSNGPEPMTHQEFDALLAEHGAETQSIRKAA